MSSFYITPFEPSNWTSMPSDLMIDQEWYRQQLQERWPSIEFLQPASRHYVLFWQFPRTVEGGGLLAGLQADLQVVSIDGPFAEFIVWHRRVIPDEYTLYLSLFGYNEVLKLTTDIVTQDVRQFLTKL